jgi:hypothetical protein
MPERHGAVNLAHRLLGVSAPDGPDVLRGVHVGRARIVAHAALDAAGGLEQRALAVEALDDLRHGVDAGLRVHLGHRAAVQIQEIGFLGLGPALREAETVDALLVGKHEEVVQILADVNVLPGQGQRSGGADVHAQRAPAAAPVIDGWAARLDALEGIRRQLRQVNHANRAIVANASAGATADAELPIVQVQAAVKGCRLPRREGQRDRLAPEEGKRLQGAQHAAFFPLFELGH